MYKIGKLIVGYEPFRDGWQLYVQRGDERINLHELSKDETVAKTRAAMLAHLFEEEVGDECRSVQAQAYQAGAEAERGRIEGTCW